jgi:hypothetical protein
MEKGHARQKGPRGYSEEFLKRFDRIYTEYSVAELDSLLRKEFPEETKGRSTRLDMWRSLAHRRGLHRARKIKGKANIMEDIVSVSINPSTPNVDIPNSISLGKYAYPIDLLRAIVQGMADGMSLRVAYEEAAKKLNTIVEKKHLPSLSNFIRLRFDTNLKEFHKIPTAKIEIILQRQQRIELVRLLKKDKWRDLAIIEKTAELFPDLDPLALEEINKIRNFWRIGRKESKRKTLLSASPQDEQIPVVRSLAKVDDSYTLSIVGPLLRYYETVKLAKAKEILKIILTENEK